MYTNAQAHGCLSMVFGWELPERITMFFLSVLLVLRYLFVWLGCILDRAQRLPLVLQFVVELSEFGSGVAGLLINSFTAFVAHLLSCI